MRQAKARRAPDDKPRWQVQFDRALALCRHGESRAAVSPLRLATQLNPGLVSAWRLLGDILIANGDFRGARQAYDRSILPMIRDADLRAAAEALAQDRLAETERTLRDLIAGRPVTRAAARQLLGETLFRQNRLAEAETELRACLREAPDFEEAHRSLARLLLAARRFAEAVVEFDIILAADPTDYACLAMKAAALTEIGRYAEATAVTATMLEQFPDQPDAWLVHANGQRTLGRSASCIAA